MMFNIKEDKIKNYIIFSILGFVVTAAFYGWNNALIVKSPIDLKMLLAMTLTYDPKIALNFFEYLSANGFQWKETFTLLVNILFLCSYAFLYYNFYGVIALNKTIAKFFSRIAPAAFKISLLLALADFIKTAILIFMVYFFRSMPTWVIFIHSTVTYIVMILYTLVLLWFLINCLFLGLGYMQRKEKA